MRATALRRPAFLVGLTAAALLPLHAGRGQDTEPLEKGWGDLAVPFLRKNCLECHGEDHAQNDNELSILSLLDAKAIDGERPLWRKVRERVRYGEMPPAEARVFPTKEDRESFVAWAKRASGSALQDPGRVVVRRLNRAEYDYTVQDLLGVKPRAQDELPADDVGYGFDRIGSVLSLPPLLLERYVQLAEQISKEAILDWKPVKVHLDASELRLKGTEGGPRDSFLVLWSNGRAEAPARVPWAGEYAIRARAYGDQAGPDPARMALLVDGKKVQTFDVPAPNAGEAKVHEAKVTLDAGEHVLAAAFTNDFFDKNNPDPKQRDRNLAVGWIEVEGPLQEPAIPQAQRTWFLQRPPAKAKPEARQKLARELLVPFASRAWRRPVKPEEVEKLVKLVELAVTEGESWERGLQLAVEAVLCSPGFLFRPETAQREPAPEGAKDAGRVETIDEYALASRLSYFVWSSLPDDELVREAQAGTLRKNLEPQVRRLLADPKASRLAEQFATQWLHLRRLETFVPDAKAFPSFDDDLRHAARAETLALFLACVQENRPVLDLVDAPFSFVNERLARHYGIEGVTGSELKRVEVPEARRGLLGHASVLLATSNPTRTSPVKRGRWVLDVILDDPPPPPTPGADSLKDDGTPFAAKNIRERLAHHREKKECAVCHARMDPLGFALEHYDATGAWRDMDGSEPVDSSGSLPDGTKIDGVPGLRTYLRAHGRQVARSLAKKLLVFGLGRGATAGDDAALDQLVDQLGPDWKLADTIVALTKLDAFQKRRRDKGGATWR